MTGALEQWVRNQTAHDRDWDQVHALSPAAAEHHIRAFCREVEKRAQSFALAHSHGVQHDPNFVDYSDAFDQLKCELLG